jgi:hypothetical protein
MSLVLGVEILGEYKNLTAATKGAQSQLGALNKRAAKISSSMNKAFAAIGIGFSLRIITQQLEEASKAAIDDAKSMDQLALAMKNTTNATAAQIAQAEKSINRMQFQAGVADDELRPAFQKLFMSTKDVTQANNLLQVALDASASTGKGLDVVTQAMARSLGGSDTALLRLIPSLKGAADPMAELERLTKGAAEAAANRDPYQRLQVLFGELQEQIGVALLPVLNKLSKWLATPEGQKKLQDLVDLAVKVLTAFSDLATWVFENRDWLVPMVVAIGSVTAAFNIATVAAKAFQAAATLGLSSGALGVGGAVAGIGAGAAVGGFMQGQQTGVNSQIYGEGFKQLGSKTLGANTTKAPVVVNVKATQSAQQIANNVAKLNKSTGTNVLSLGFNRLL